MSTIWSKPQNGCVKINVKGVFVRSEMKAAIACIMRDEHGNWIKGCQSMIGLAVPVTAELWSIWYGLRLAWEKGEKSVILECECEDAVNQVLYPDENNEMFDLIVLIRHIMSESWDHCDIVHIPGSANLTVAALANRAIHAPGGLEDLLEPPSCIRKLLNEDKVE